MAAKRHKAVHHSAVWLQRKKLGLKHVAHGAAARAAAIPTTTTTTVIPAGTVIPSGYYDNGTGPLQDGGKHVSNATLQARTNRDLLTTIGVYAAIAATAIGLIFVTRKYKLLTGGK